MEDLIWKKFDTSNYELEAVIKPFDNYYSVVSEAKHKTKYGKGLEILKPKQMLQRLPVALAQVRK